MTKRQVQANRTKERIYQAAIKLLESDGFENIRIEDICRDAGVSVGSFYNYFNSKNEILELIFKQADEYFLQRVNKNILPLEPKAALHNFFEAYAAYSQNTGLLTIRQLYCPDNQFFTKKRGMQDVLESIFKTGQEKKVFSEDFSPEEMVKLFFMVARGVVYDWCIRCGEYDLVEKMNLVIDQYMRAFTL